MYLKNKNNILNESYNKKSFIEKGVGPYIYLENNIYNILYFFIIFYYFSF